MAQQPAVLIAHGFTGSPHELRALAAFLEDRGLHVQLPTLPGHDTSPHDLLENGPDIWLAALQAEYDALHAKHDLVGVLGLSVGGSLAVKLAAGTNPAFLATIGAPVRLSYHQLMRLALKVYRLLTPDLVKPDKGFFANEEIPGFTQRCYDRVPIAAFEAMMRFLERDMIPATFRAVQAPSLIIQGTHDPIVAPWSAQRLLIELGSAEKRLVLWEDPYHLIVQGQRKEALYTTIADWIASTTTLPTGNRLHL